MKIHLCGLLAAVFLLTVEHVRGQEIDSTTISAVYDPASNRLFWMSTGRVMASERGSIGFMGAPYLIPWFPYATFIQGGYAPNSFLQFNLTGSLSYFSIGTKIQPIQTTGPLLGIAVGADFGFYPQNFAIASDNRVQALNIAASFGSEQVAAHVNVMQVIQNNYSTSGVIPSYVQLGLSAQLGKGKRIQSKLMAELWFVNEYYKKELQLGLLMVGMRSFSKSFVWEAAFLFGPRISFGGHGSSNDKLQFIPLPYASFMWYI